MIFTDLLVRTGGSLSPRQSRATLAKTARIIYLQRELLREMSIRMLHSAHARHGLGGAWVYVQPLIVVGVYLLVFGFVFGRKIQVAGEFPGDYPSYILIGLVPWLMMQAALTRGPTALIGNSSLVKQIVFPVEILPVAAVAAAMIPYIPAFLLVLAYKIIAAGGLPLTTLLLPVAVLLIVAIATGLSFALAAVTPFIRDVGEVVLAFCSVALYLMPIVYLPGWVPAVLRPIVYIIPFSYPAWVMQDVLYFGYIAHPVAWLVTTVLAVICLIFGFRTFEMLKPYFGNVL